jgi:hypothetical protein
MGRDGKELHIALIPHDPFGLPIEPEHETRIGYPPDIRPGNLDQMHNKVHVGLNRLACP